jgi:hypothetical protein
VKEYSEAVRAAYKIQNSYTVAFDSVPEKAEYEPFTISSPFKGRY